MTSESDMQKLQMFEQNLQNLAQQKQQFQAQLFEIEGALKEIATAKSTYKLIGGIMVHTDTQTLKTELESKKELMELRVQTLEKQEKQLKEKATKLQHSLLGKE
ncbi:prefoldin subunit beta [Candidatus Woesearchaeota archaeon]|nr:MAG: prefoldin subunit beta [Candidatus Woesearchaeota archaeon]